jgi:anti-sigma B factor antagonist
MGASDFRLGWKAVSFAEAEIEIHHEDPDDRTRVIIASGEIHVSTASVVSAALSAALDEDRTAIVLDLTKVGFIDSTGLSVLLNGLRKVTRARGRLALVCVSPTVLRLFAITKLDTTFDIVGSRKDALERVRRAVV